jgi:hypothetical protein
MMIVIAAVFIPRSGRVKLVRRCEGGYLTPRSMPASLSASDRARELLASPRSLWLLVGLAIVLGLPTLDIGFVGDDLRHEAFLRAQHAGRSDAPWWDMFGLVEGPPARILGLRRAGRVPWWTDPQLRVVFFRPLAVATRHLDHALWPGTPWLMHLHSVVWHALACALAWALARRLCPRASTAGLVALIYALAYAHTTPVAWLAHRNGLVATSFALAALLAHDSWRRDHSRVAGLLAPVALAASLLSAEAGVVTLAFVLAHALIYDPATGPRRLLALLPSLAVVACWWVLYSTRGFGAVASGAYCDPFGDPATFFASFPRRYASLLAASLALPLMPGVPAGLGWGLWLASALLVGLAVVVFLVRVPSKPARFGAIALVLGCVPLTASHPGDRLLVLTSFASALIFGELIAAWLGGGSAGSSWAGKALAAAVLVVHVLLPPAARLFTSARLDRLAPEASAVAFGESLPNEGLGRKGLVVVHAPDVLGVEYLPAARALRGLEAPNFLWLLHAGPRPPGFVRVDARTIELRDPRGWPGDELAAFWRSVAREPFEVGDTIETLDYVAEVLEVDAGRATRVRFRFRTRLEHPSFVWSAWDGREFVELDPRAFARESYIESDLRFGVRSRGAVGGW